MFRSSLLAIIIILLFQVFITINNPSWTQEKIVLGASALIPMVSNDDILKKINKGDKVIFIDAREPEEFEEDHIPGALNITLRQVNREVASKLNNANIVITYCLKDFRGYELGRALKIAGLNNIHTMQDPGINGWKKQGLPYASRDGLTDVIALARLSQCAADRNYCQHNKLTQTSYVSNIPAT